MGSFNVKMRSKIALVLGLLVLPAIGVSVIGYRDVSRVYRDLVAMHDDQLTVALSVASTASQLNAVRAALLGMMAAPDRAAQEALHEQIRTLTRDIDTAFAALLDGARSDDVAAGLRDVRQVWQAFRDTRDGELIPAIYAGRLDEARAIATGVQAERYRRFSTGAARLVDDARGRALGFKQAASDRHRRAVAWFLGMSLASVGLVLVLTYVSTRALTRPLERIVGTLTDLADGDVDLTRRLETGRRDEVGLVALRFNAFMDHLQRVVGEARGAATELSRASVQLSAATTELSGGAQDQAASLEETAASLEEISSTVRQNADSSQQANQLATQSREAAERGGDVVRSAVAAMAEISGSSRRIADMTTTIEEIAFQTNLLALNAAVEAARAGQEGRGFAVVAAEVRALAQRAGTAAKEIKKLIDDSVAKVQVGSDAVTRSGQTLEEIVTSVKRVTDIIAEIAAASREQTMGIDQVNRAVAQMDQVVQGTTGQTERISSTAQGLAAQAAELQALVARFRLDDATGSAVTARPAALAQPAPVADIAGGPAPRARLTPSARQVAGRQPAPPAERRAPALAGAGSTNGRGGRHATDGFEEF
jgi:methyl-accepting chemotaxis protein